MRATTFLVGVLLAALGAALVSRERPPAAQPPAVAISRVTLAATNMPAMTRFYNAVFGAGLRETAIGGVAMQSGTLAGLELLLCPNEVAKVDAALNRHMLRIVVDALDPVIVRVRENGGSVDAPPTVSDGIRLLAVRDPDGNTIELAERR